MGFEHLIEKVEQAEKALEQSERTASAGWRQLKASWRSAWTPGRIVVAGLASGFLVGRSQPLKSASGSGVLNLMSALGGLMASGSAQAAAGEASTAATEAERTAQAVDPDSTRVARALPRDAADIRVQPVRRADMPRTESDVLRAHDDMRRSGLL